jgi:uncharacterized protein
LVSFFYSLLLLLIFCTPINAAKSIEDKLPNKPNELITNLSVSLPRFLSQEEKLSLENKLVEFANQTGVQIAILITDDLLELDPNDYSTRVFNKWGIGDKTNRGILILIKPTSPRVIYINTGYASEGYLPDASAKLIIERVLKPNFKQGLYYQGLDQATNVIIESFGTDVKKTTVPKDSKLLMILLPLFIFFFVVLNEKFGSKRSSMTLGSRSKHGSDDSIVPFLLGYGAGSIFGHRGGGDDHWGGGGGFGGFGGGMSGGGGAGGDW